MIGACSRDLVGVGLHEGVGFLANSQWMTSFMSVWVEEQYSGWIMMVDGVEIGLGLDRWVIGLGNDGSWVGSRIGVGLDGGVGGVVIVLGLGC